MIRSFKNKETENLFNNIKVKHFQSVEKIARRKLLILNSAGSLQDLTIPPGNYLEALSKDRKGQHSIRINDRYRICFVWSGNDAHDVEIVDYH